MTRLPLALLLLAACAPIDRAREPLPADGDVGECWIDYEHGECVVTVCPGEVVLIVGCDGDGYDTVEGT